jgi:hypothetical protein
MNAQVKQHTPGPWKVTKTTRGAAVLSSSNGYICQPSEEDANLIAAAPDMAEALQNIIATPDGRLKTKGQMFLIAKTALAKAGL